MRCSTSSLYCTHVHSCVDTVVGNYVSGGGGGSFQHEILLEAHCHCHSGALASPRPGSSLSSSHLNCSWKAVATVSTPPKTEPEAPTFGRRSWPPCWWQPWPGFHSLREAFTLLSHSVLLKGLLGKSKREEKTGYNIFISLLSLSPFSFIFIPDPVSHGCWSS